MRGFTWAAAASIAVGMSIGVATTVGITLAATGHADHSLVPAQTPALPSGPNLVEYGERCFHGHCLHW